MSGTQPSNVLAGPWPGLALELSRWFAAPRAKVFTAFTDPVLLRQWWGPRGFFIEEIEFPAIEGSAYRVALRAPDGSRYVHVGKFLIVQRPSRLSYSWRWVEGPMDSRETLVELSFTTEGEGTRIELRHSRFPTQAVRDAHCGWPDSFAQFERWLAQQPAE